MTSVTSVFKISKRPVFTFLLQVAGAVSKHLGLNLARCTNQGCPATGVCVGSDPIHWSVTSTCPRVHVSNLLPDFSLDCQTVNPQQKHPDNPVYNTSGLSLQEWLYVLNDSVTTPRSWCRTLGKNEHLMPVQQGKGKESHANHALFGWWAMLRVLAHLTISKKFRFVPLDAVGQASSKLEWSENLESKSERTLGIPLDFAPWKICSWPFAWISAISAIALLVMTIR